MQSQKVTFKKSQKLLAENRHEISILAIVRTELLCLGGEQFLWFFKMTSYDFTLFYSFLTQANVIFLDVLGKEYYS